MNLLFLYLKNSFKNPFLSGSFVMMIGLNLHNVGQFVYHLLAIKLLNAAQYGDLAVLVSLFGLLAIVQQSLGLAVVKFIASAKNDEESNNLAKWIFFWVKWAGLVTALVIVVITPFISDFLHISQPNAVYLFAPVVFIASLSNTGRSLLQGFIKFIPLVASMIVEVSVKIVLTVVLLYLGYALFGAMIGLLAAVIVGFTIVWFTLKVRLSGKRGQVPNIVPLVKYSLPVLVQSLALTSMYSMDLLLVKHFFSPESAGVYAGLAKLGTIALFIAAPITSVMFPLIAKKYSHGEAYHKVFYLSFAIVAGLSLFVVLVYRLFGSLLLSTLQFGDKFIESSYLLWWFGLYMLLLGLGMLFTHFYLSIGKTKIVYLFAVAAIAQIILILMFHSTLLSVIQVSIIAAALLVLGLLIYFPYHHQVKRG